VFSSIRFWDSTEHPLVFSSIWFWDSTEHPLFSSIWFWDSTEPMASVILSRNSIKLIIFLWKTLRGNKPRVPQRPRTWSPLQPIGPDRFCVDILCCWVSGFHRSCSAYCLSMSRYFALL
jgi:hypothetical protein